MPRLLGPRLCCASRRPRRPCRRWRPGGRRCVEAYNGTDAWTVQHAKWFKKNGRRGQEAKPGAVVFFDYSGDGISDIKHVGFVEKKNSDGTVSTIEGNADNAVKKNVREPSEIAGYGYPDYVS